MSKHLSIRTTHGLKNMRVVWERDGLAVTESLDRGYVISHVESGWCVVRVSQSAPDAVAMANRLLPLGDWHRTIGEMLSDMTFYCAVWDVIDLGRHSLDPESFRRDLMDKLQQP